MPDWMQPDRLRGVFEEEKAVPQVFQPLPFYFIEVAQLLFRHNPSETFGSEEQFAEVRHLLEDIRKVRYNKIETGLRKVSGAITVKLNNLAAAECNMIRLLFKGTLDHFYELNKNNKAWEQASLNPSMSMPSL
ncbi:DNA replication complex GINS protein PSF2, partial [Haematococcus lacustris]